MLSARDRLLAGLFGLQLLAAALFGVVLLGQLGKPVATQQVVAAPGAPGTDVVAASPQPSPSGGTTATEGTSGTAGTAGTAATSGTTATTSQAGSGDANAGSDPGAGAGAATVKGGAPIKVGAVVTQTGAINFASAAQGTKAYLDMVNAAGGVNGRKIALDLRDDQLDPARGRAQAQQLVADGAFAFVGFNAPLTENGIVPFLEQNKIPLVGGYGQQQEYHSRQSFIFSASYGHYGYEMGKFLGEQKVSTPGFIFIDNMSAAANDGLKAGFRAGLKAAGKTITDGHIQVVDVTKASYDDVVTSFRLDGVDGFATILDQTAYNRLLQSQDRAAYRPVHVAIPLFLDPSVRQGPSTDGVFVATDLELPGSSSAAVKEYVDTVRKAFGSKAQINYIGVQGWLGAKVFVDALRRVGPDLTRAKLITALESTSGKDGFGFSAPLTFGPYNGKGRDINRCLKMLKVVQGKGQQLTDWRCDAQPF